MIVPLDLLFLLLNIPLFTRLVLGDTNEDPSEIRFSQLVPWLAILTIWPAITYACSEYFGDDGVIDVILQAYVAACWFALVKVYLIGRRALDRHTGDEPPFIRLFTFLLLLLFGGLIGNVVWVLFRLAPPRVAPMETGSSGWAPIQAMICLRRLM